MLLEEEEEPDTTMWDELTETYERLAAQLLVGRLLRLHLQVQPTLHGAHLPEDVLGSGGARGCDETAAQQHQCCRSEGRNPQTKNL